MSVKDVKIELNGSLVSVDEAINLVRAICVLVGDWIPHEKSDEPEVSASAKKEIRRSAVALMGKYNILLDQIKKERDTAWQELREIREAIKADDLESTADEVKSLVSKYNAARRTLEDHGPEGHNCTNQQFTDLRKELDEIEVKVKQACANAYCGNVCACEEAQIKDPNYCCCSQRDAILGAKT